MVNDIRDLNERLGQKDCMSLVIIVHDLEDQALFGPGLACQTASQGRPILLPHPKALEVEGSPLP